MMIKDSPEPSSCGGRIARSALVLARGTPAANLVRSPWMSPAQLLALRLVLALFVFSWWVVMLTAANFEQRAVYVVIYFTNTSFTGIMIVSVLLAYLSLRYYRDPRSARLARSPFTRAAASVFYALALSYSLIVTTVYWSYFYPQYPEDQKYPPYTFPGFHDVVVHALNVVFCAVHFLSSAIHVGTWWLLVPVVGTGILYYFWTWIFHAALDKWAYPFLEFGTPASKYMYPSITAAFFVSYALVKLAHSLRNWLVVRYCGPDAARLFDPKQQQLDNDGDNGDYIDGNGDGEQIGMRGPASRDDSRSSDLGVAQVREIA